MIAANKEDTEPRVPFGKVEVITSKILRSPPWLGWPFRNICVTNDHGYVPLVVSTSRSFPRSRLITGFVTRLTWRVPLVEQELFTLPEHLSSLPAFSGVRVTRSLALYVCIVYRCLSFCTFSFRHCVVCSSSIRVITKLLNSEQSYKGKVKTHKYINRQNQSTTGKLWKP